MTKAPSKTHTTGMREAPGMLPVLFPIDRLLSGNGQGLEAWTEMSRALTDRFGTWQSEAARFVARRLEEELSSQRELSACRTPSEAVDVCSAFTRRAVRDYMEEAAKVTDLAGEMTRAWAVFGESLAGSTVRAARSGGNQSPVAAAAEATDEARAGIAA